MCLHHVLQFKIIIIEAKDSKMIKYQLNTNHSKIIKIYKFLKLSYVFAIYEMTIIF